ncbi:hypothetical protein D0Y65_012232, partial [Glycine soja]
IDDNTEMEVNEPETDTTTQNMSSTKENGQRKRSREGDKRIGVAAKLSSQLDRIIQTFESSVSAQDPTSITACVVKLKDLPRLEMSSSLSSNDSSSGDDDHITKNKVLMFVVANVSKILNGHPIRCYQMFRMKKLIFIELCDILETKDTPDEILKDAKYRLYFRDCIGAIDGTHIRVCVPSHLQGVYIGRKGYTTTNVMVVCDFSMCFTFIFMEALCKPAFHFPHPPQGKYYLVDSGYPTFMDFLGPYKKTRNDKSDGEFDSLDEDNEYIDSDEDESEVGPNTTIWEEPDAQSTLQMERLRESSKNIFSTRI